MPSTEIVFGVSQPGDPDYPLKATEGAAGSIAEIRKRCNKDNPYEDPDFPATRDSIVGGDETWKRIASCGWVWKRAPQICKELNVGAPQFAVLQEGLAGETERISALDIRQWGIGDCWFLSAVATLTTDREQLKIIIPEDNFDGFEDDKYCGAFHFRLYCMSTGKYADIVVDDRIPCWVDNQRPAFLKVLTNDGKGNEFWTGLLEKAFAKWRGSYRQVEAGVVFVALEYLTGGFTDVWQRLHKFKEQPKYDELKAKVKGFLARKALLGLQAHHRASAAAIGADDGYGDAGFGLSYSHGYSLLGSAEVAEKGDPSKVHFLIKVRNPLGTNEWRGRYSDKDDDGWAKLEKDLRPRSAKGSADVDDGAFWMDFDDVLKYFFQMDYCLYGLADGTKFCLLRSEWPAALQGKKEDLKESSYAALAPAFSFEVKRELENVKIPPEHEGKCVLSLRVALGEPGVTVASWPAVFYYIYEVPEGTGAVSADKLDAIYKKNFVTYGASRSGRELVNGVNIYLKPGTYVMAVVLRTEEVDKIPKGYEGKPIPFAVSIFTENETSLNKVN